MAFVLPRPESDHFGFMPDTSAGLFFIEPMLNGLKLGLPELPDSALKFGGSTCGPLEVVGHFLYSFREVFAGGPEAGQRVVPTPPRHPIVFSLPSTTDNCFVWLSDERPAIAQTVHRPR